MDNIVVTINGEGTALLELNRPLSLNALNSALISEVRSALHELADRPDVKVLIITGRGRAFCAGADLGTGVLEGDNNASAGERVAQKMHQEFNPMMELLYAFPRPVITAINGIAAGGGAGIALCADLVLASNNAALKVVQAQQLGIAADLGANWLLSRIEGRTRALGMCLLGDTIPAATLLDWGLVWECVEHDELIAKSHEYARRLAGVPASTVIATRRLVDEAPHRTFDQSIEDERLQQRQLCDAPVFMDSIRKFQGKNSPRPG